MSLTKAVESVDAWAEVVAGTVREGATIDLTPNYETILLIDVCLAKASAETAGCQTIVQISSNTTGDNNWSPIAVLGGPIGTAFKTDIAADEAAGQTVLSVTNPTTANLDHPGKFLFIENTGTPANSEIVFQVSNEGDAGDTITILDGLTNAQAAADGDIWEIDSATASVVAQFVVSIPASAYRVRVLYNNIQATGADVFTRCLLAKITAVS